MSAKNGNYRSLPLEYYDGASMQLPYGQRLTENEIARFYSLCEAMERFGNQGWRRETLEVMCPSGSFIFQREFVPQRENILVFAGGNWKLRRKPSWKDTFRERFPAWCQENRVLL